MTQIEFARIGRVTPQMRQVSKDEGQTTDYIRRNVASGRIVIPNNSKRRVRKPCGIGLGLKTKINANIGTSKNASSIKMELEKLRVAVRLGSDTIMDLSTGNDIAGTRRKMLNSSPVPVGTVPIYEIAIDGKRRFGEIKDIPADYMFDILEEQAKDGVDFFTIHAGVTKKTLSALKDNPRVLGIVSRGGAILANWILSNSRENPFYEYFDRVLEITKRHDVTISLGDGLRPGSIKDATDIAQIGELVVLGELQRRALSSGVQVMIEGPGHVPINQVETNVILEKSICNGAPFYVLGPLVTDVAPGYDHITSAIGGAIAGASGADFLCYVTPSEHLRLPTLDDVREGVMASKIAAHAADIAKGVKGSFDWDVAISRARARRDWPKQFKLAMDSSKPKSYRSFSKPNQKDVCTMCQDYCSIKMSNEAMACGAKRRKP